MQDASQFLQKIVDEVRVDDDTRPRTLTLSNIPVVANLEHMHQVLGTCLNTLNTLYVYHDNRAGTSDAIRLSEDDRSKDAMMVEQTHDRLVDQEVNRADQTAQLQRALHELEVKEKDVQRLEQQLKDLRMQHDETLRELSFVKELSSDDALVSRDRWFEIAGAYQTFQNVMRNMEDSDLGQVMHARNERNRDKVAFWASQLVKHRVTTEIHSDAMQVIAQMFPYVKQGNFRAYIHGDDNDDDDGDKGDNDRDGDDQDADARQRDNSGSASKDNHEKGDQIFGDNDSYEDDRGDPDIGDIGSSREGGDHYVSNRDKRSDYDEEEAVTALQQLGLQSGKSSAECYKCYKKLSNELTYLIGDSVAKEFADHLCYYCLQHCAQTPLIMTCVKSGGTPKDVAAALTTYLTMLPSSKPASAAIAKTTIIICVGANIISTPSNIAQEISTHLVNVVNKLVARISGASSVFIVEPVMREWCCKLSSRAAQMLQIMQDSFATLAEENNWKFVAMNQLLSEDDFKDNLHLKSSGYFKMTQAVYAASSASARPVTCGPSFQARQNTFAALTTIVHTPSQNVIVCADDQLKQKDPTPEMIAYTRSVAEFQSVSLDSIATPCLPTRHTAQAAAIVNTLLCEKKYEGGGIRWIARGVNGNELVIQHTAATGGKRKVGTQPEKNVSNGYSSYKFVAADKLNVKQQRDNTLRITRTQYDAMMERRSELHEKYDLQTLDLNEFASRPGPDALGEAFIIAICYLFDEMQVSGVGEFVDAHIVNTANPNVQFSWHVDNHAELEGGKYIEHAVSCQCSVGSSAMHLACERENSRIPYQGVGSFIRFYAWCMHRSEAALVGHNAMWKLVGFFAPAE